MSQGRHRDWQRTVKQILDATRHEIPLRISERICALGVVMHFSLLLSEIVSRG